MKEREKFTRREVLTISGITLLATGLALLSKKEPEVNQISPVTRTPTSTEISPTETPTPPPQEPTREATQTPEQPRIVEIIVTGDVMLGRSVELESEKLGDFTYPLKKVARTLRDVDIVFINLESPIMEGCPESKSLKEMIFCAEPKMVEALVNAGVDVATVANNHLWDHGQKGVEDTYKYLQEKGISVTGRGEVVKRKIQENTFGFLGMDFVSKMAQESDFMLVEKAKEDVDSLIISVHWGVEYTDTPTELQKKWARQLVEAGADFIVGHHPHTIQTNETIGGVPVYYSVGNLSFDQMWRITRRGLVLKIIFQDGQRISHEEMPTEMGSWAQPEFIENKLENLREELKDLL